MMRKLIAFALFLLPSVLLGQAVRYNAQVYTINASQPLPNALYPVLASSSATINVCTAPATGFTVLNAATNTISGGCTNYATTYTNAAQTGTCSAPTQLTRTNSTTCVGNVDAEGGFGAWMAAGTYQYTVTLSYGSFGPYDFSVGGTGGGGGGGTPVGFGAQQYSNITASSFINGGIYNTDQYATGVGGNGQTNYYNSTNCIAAGSCAAFMPPTSPDPTAAGFPFTPAKSSSIITDNRANSIGGYGVNPSPTGLSIFDGYSPPRQALYSDFVTYTEASPSPIQGNPQVLRSREYLNGSPGFAGIGGESPYVPPNWSASTTILLSGQISVTISGTAYVFSAIQAGITGSTSPVFSATLGSTVTDNTVIWRNIGLPHTAVGQWALHNVETLFSRFNGTGINNVNTCYNHFESVGDSQGCFSASFDFYSGGTVFPSDEGHHGGSIHIDSENDFSGTIATITDPAHLTVSPIGNSGTQGQGRFLINPTPINGTDSQPIHLIPISLIRMPGDTYPYGTVVFQASNIPNSTFQGVMASACTVSMQQGSVTSCTVNVTVSSGQMCAIGLWNGSTCSGTKPQTVCLAANKWNQFNFAQPTAVGAVSGGVQSVTVNVTRSVPVGGYVFQGGLCGGYLNTDESQNISNQVGIQGYPLIGSFGGNTVAYMNYDASQVWQVIPNQGALWGSRDTGNTPAAHGFRVINLVRTSGVVNGLNTTGFDSDKWKELAGAFDFSVSGCADTSFNTPVLGTPIVYTGPDPSVSNPHQGQISYAQAGANSTCSSAVIATQLTAADLNWAAEVYDVQNHSSGQVDGTFFTSWQPNFAVSNPVDQPVHYAANVSGMNVNMELGEPLLGSGAFQAINHGYSSYVGAAYTSTNFYTYIQGSNGIHNPLDVVDAIGLHDVGLSLGTAPPNNGSAIRIGVPDPLFASEPSVFRTYGLIQLDWVINNYKTALNYNDDLGQFEWDFDHIAYPFYTFSDNLVNFSITHGTTGYVPVQVGELRFAGFGSHPNTPYFHYKQCAPLAPVTPEVDCYGTDVPTNAVITQSGTPGSTRYDYILQINDTYGPGYGSIFSTFTGNATLSGTNFNNVPCSDLPAGATGIMWNFVNPFFQELGTCTSAATVLHDTGTYTTIVGTNGTIAGTGFYSGALIATGTTGGFLFTQPDVYGTSTPALTITGGFSQTSAGNMSVDSTAIGNGLGNLSLHNLTITGTCTGCTGGGGGVTSINTVPGAFTFTGPAVSCTSTTCTFSATGATFEVNGTGLSSSSTINFLNSAATNGLTLTFTNTSAGNIQLGLSGSLTNAGLANSSTTVNGQTCALGGTCTTPNFTSSTNGLVPASGGGTVNFLRADGIWAAGGGVSGSGTTGTLPIWTGATALGNSHIDETTTTGTVTVKLPMAIDPNDVGCIQTGTNEICITFPPYYASKDGLSTTTTSGTNAPGTTINITAGGCVAAKFDSTSAGSQYGHQGVYIAGAGAAGAQFIGTVSTCVTGTPDVMTLTSTTSTSVSTGTLVQHDETTAFIAAFSAIQSAGGGTIWVPAGDNYAYLVNGPLLDTSGANAVLPVPKIPNYTTTALNLSIKGQAHPSWGTNAQNALIITSQNTGNFIGGYDAATGGGIPPFTNVHLDLENLFIQGPSNCGVVLVNETAIIAAINKSLVLNCGSTITSIPTNTAGGGLFMPAILNEVENIIDDVTTGGTYTGFKLTEHTHAGAIYASYCSNCFDFDHGTSSVIPGSYSGNSVSVDYMWEQSATNPIVFTGTIPPTVNVQVADIEAFNGPGITNLISGNLSPQGEIHFNNMSPSPSGSNPCMVTLSGYFDPAHIKIRPLQCNIDSANLTQGLIENWTAQEARGSVLNNTGYDFTNKMTNTAVTWTSSLGFHTNVATYNGSTSQSIAASATNTAFDGTAPFSACAWFNTTNSASSSGETIMGNLSASPSFTGWRVNVTTHWIVFGIISNFATSNAIYQRSPASGISDNTLYNVCVTYDGTGTTTSQHIFINGVDQTLTSIVSPLTGSSANSNPLTIGYDANISGDQFTGVIGGNHIWQRKLSATDVIAEYFAGPF